MYRCQTMEMRRKFLLQKSRQLIRENQELGIENSGHFRLEFEGNPTRMDVMELLYWYSEQMTHRLLSHSEEPFLAFRNCLQDIRELGFDNSLKRHFGISEKELFQSL